jgi:hypothetical protein
MRFSLIRVRSPLLTESLLFSLPAGTEMFHFPAFPPHTLCIQMRVTRHHACWVSPFGHPRITARLAAPRGLSQPTTSFIGSWCQGIHRVLLHTYIHKQLKMLASTVQFSNNTHQPHPHQDHQVASASGISAIRNNHTRHRAMVLFQTPNSVFRPGHPLPRTQPALSRRLTRSRRVLRDSVPPNEPPSAPRTGTNRAITLTTPESVVSAP